MKIRIEVDNKNDDEIVIKCKEINDEVKKIQDALLDIISKKEDITFYKDQKEFYFSLDKVLFFETEGSSISAHTVNDCFTVKYKLYELEKLLPEYFVRISKSTILNVNHIYSISRNITGASLVEFQNTYKKVYVSRNYFKVLKLKLEKR